MLLTIFDSIPDHRRTQGRLFELKFVLLFTILATVSNADSYRSIASFIKAHFKTLKKRFQLNWKKSPGYTTVRKIIQGVDPATLEQAMRAHAKSVSEFDRDSVLQVCLDGKTIRGSFDHFKDQNMIQMFSAFLANQQLILRHEMIPDKKTNEIPVMQHLIKELGLEDRLLTADALHCQKKRSLQPKKQEMR